jgi:hypothetical protein
MLQKKTIKNKDLLLEISIEKYNLFCKKLEHKITKPNLEIFQDQGFCATNTRISKEIFSEEISIIKSLLNNPDIGISSIDIPKTNILDNAIENIASAAVALGIFNNIGSSAIDPLNLTPFTLHSASHKNAKLLSSEEYTPDVKLGFHNDGLIKDRKIELPIYIMLYNLYLGYREPGNFRWIPTTLWNDKENFMKKITPGKTSIKMKLTPHINLHKDAGLTTKKFDDIEIPIINMNKNGQIRFFLNGKISPNEDREENINLVEMIKKSLENNPTHLCIPQKERRAIFINNTNGFHARDIFKEPFEEIDLTRVFLRSIDCNAEQYPSTHIMLE